MNYLSLFVAFIAFVISSLGYSGKIPKKYENASFLISISCSIVLIFVYGFKIPVK